MAYWPQVCCPQRGTCITTCLLRPVTPTVQLLTGLPQRVPSNRITTLLCMLETQVHYLTFQENNFDKISFVFFDLCLNNIDVLTNMFYKQHIA